MAGAGRAGRHLRRSLDFSFAGLKTALLYQLRELSEAEARARRADLAASYQAAIVDSLILRAEHALERTGSAAWRWGAAWPPTASCAGGWASSTRSCTFRHACCAPTTPR